MEPTEKMGRCDPRQFALCAGDIRSMMSFIHEKNFSYPAISLHRLFFFLSWSQCMPFLEAVERKMITEALARCGGVQTRAAEMLGISERALRYKLNKYGLYDDSTTR